MSQRRREALQRLQQTQDHPTRFLRLRMILAVLIFLINFAVSIPLVGLSLLLLYGFFSEGTSFVLEIIATNGEAMEGRFSKGSGFFFILCSGFLAMGLAFVSGYWIVVKSTLLSREQVWDLNARLGRASIFGLFEKERKNPPRHEFKN